MTRLTGRRAGWLAAAVVLVLLGVWVVAFSPLLGVHHVQVRGTTALKPVAVTEAAQISSGTPLLRLDTDQVAARIEKLPFVAKAVVRTQLPGTVTITVTERVPVGFVVASEGYMLVDKTGRLFSAVPAAPTNLPKFIIPSDPSDIDPTADATGSAVASVAASLSAGIRAKLSSIDANSPDAITLELTDGRSVRWGDSTRSTEKAALLPALLAHTGTVFDVSDPTQVYSH